MKAIIKTAAALVVGITALGVTAAYADHDDRRRDRDRYDNHRDDDRRSDRRDDRRADYDRRDDRRRDGRRPDRCSVDHDHRTHQRDYYSYYPKDRYYNDDPEFSVSLNFGNRGYYDRGGRYYDKPYYDRRGYRDGGRVIRRDRYNLRRYRADAILIEEVFGGRRGHIVCTVTARGPDARYVSHGELRSIAARKCSRRSQIRVYA